MNNCSNPLSKKYTESKQLSEECSIKQNAIALAFNQLKGKTKPSKSNVYLRSQEIDKMTKIALTQQKIDILKGKI